MLDLGYINKLINDKKSKEARDIVNYTKEQFPNFEEAVEYVAKVGRISGPFKLWLPENIERVTDDDCLLAFTTLKEAYQPLDIRFSCRVVTYEIDYNTDRKYLDLWFMIPTSKDEVEEYGCGDRVVWEVE